MQDPPYFARYFDGGKIDPVIFLSFLLRLSDYFISPCAFLFSCRHSDIHNVY